MLIEHINELFEYNYWATHRILDSAEKLTTEEFLAPNRFPHGGVHQTLTHIFFAEWLWRKRIQGRSPQAGEKMIDPEDFPALEIMRKAWTKEEQSMLAYLDTQEDDDLLGTVHYKTTTGVEYQEALGAILTHIPFHGMQHRAEVAQMLTESGHSPGDIDFIIRLREME